MTPEETTYGTAVNPFCEAATRIVLAMADWKLNRIEESRDSFANADAFIQYKLPSVHAADLGETCWNTLVVRCLLREAEAAGLAVDASFTINSPDLLARRADRFARQGSWKEAIQELTRLCELQPTNHWHYHSLLRLLLLSGDQEGWARCAERLLGQFGRTGDYRTAVMSACDCLMSATFTVSPVVLSNWVSVADDGGRGPWPSKWGQLVKALALYRQGHFADAKLEAAVGVQAQRADGDDHFCAAGLRIVFALAQWQLNEREKSCAWMANARNFIQQIVPDITNIDPGERWQDALLVRTLLTEAQSIPQWQLSGEKTWATPPMSLLELETVSTRVLTSAHSGRCDRVFWLLFRGKVYVSRGSWAEAISDFRQSIAWDANMHEAYHRLAPVLVQSGDQEGYRALCREAVRQFRNTKNREVAHRMLKDCLFVPNSGVEPGALETWSRLTLSDPNFAAWWAAQFTKGLWDYRQGDFTGAIQWLEQCDKSKSSFAERWVQIRAVLAMAYFKNNQPDKARATLNKAIEVAAKPIGPDGFPEDWIFNQFFLKEARALIESSGAAESDPAQPASRPGVKP